MVKKTIKQLTVGDILFECRPDDTHFKLCSVWQVERKDVFLDGANVSYIPRTGIANSGVVNGKSYGRWVYFTSEADALRYVKAQALSTLRKYIEEAKIAIKKVKDFRELNHDGLNKDWIETTVVELEKELQ